MLCKASQAKVEERKANPKMLGALAWIQQSESPGASSVASSTPQTETSTTGGTIDTIGCTSLDLCAQDIANPRWRACNVDTGAGGTVWPIDADYACEKVSGPAGHHKTATGDMVEGQGRFRVRCQSVWRHQLHMIGEKTSVHNECWRRDRQGTRTLVGRRRWLHHPEISPILTAMRTCFEKACLQHSWNGAIDLRKERGVYNLYVQVAGGDINVEQAVDVSPMKWRLKSRDVVHRGAFGR